MSDSYYRFFPGDYLRDTGDLTLIEHGAYHVLLDHYYMMESLPSDRERLYRMCRVVTDQDKKAVEFVVERYFKDDGNGKLYNRKAEEELELRRIFIKEQTRKGLLSAEKRRGKDNRGYSRGTNLEDSTAVLTTAITAEVTGRQPRDSNRGYNQPSPSPSFKEKKENKQKKETPPAGEAAAAVPSEKPTEKENPSKHFADILEFDSEILNRIQDLCIRISKLRPGPKPFNPYEAVQSVVNQNLNPLSIILGLDAIIKGWTKIESPWPYFKRIVENDSMNQNEKFQIEQHYDLMEALKKIKVPDFLQSIPSLPQKDESARIQQLKKQAEIARRQSNAD